VLFASLYVAREKMADSECVSEYENSNETSSESEGEETSKTMIVKKRRQRREN